MLQLAAITAPFYPRLAELGEFEEVQPADMPPDYQTLLAHDDHMTVTVEAFHGSLVDVRVLEEHREGDVYTRASLLALQSDGRVVQLGIMRIDMRGLSPVVCEEIDAKRMPLGRILIRHNVLRHVKLERLWRIRPGAELRKHLGYVGESLRDSRPVSEKPAYVSGECIFGRTAGIEVEGRPAVELLEMVRA